MRRSLLIFLIPGILVFSGCLQEYSNISITNVDVMSTRQDEGTLLTVTSYIQNNQETDSALLTIKVKVRDPASNLIVAEKDSDIGYIKARSSYQDSSTLTISTSGEFAVEVQLFERGKLVSQYFAPVKIRATPGPGQPSDIKLTDIVLTVTKIYTDGNAALVEVSPGILNQGGDSKPLIIEVTARVDQYTAYTKTDEMGTLTGGNSVRSKVSFDLPRNKIYSFSVSVMESGKKAVSGKVNERIELNKIKYNAPLTYVLVEEGKPIAEKPATAGFESLIALVGLLFVYLFVRKVNK
jgi:hypothetical protein